MKPDDALKVTQEEMDACCPCRLEVKTKSCVAWCKCWHLVTGPSGPCRWPGHTALKRRDAAVRYVEATGAYLAYMRFRRSSKAGHRIRERMDEARKAFEEASK